MQTFELPMFLFYVLSFFKKGDIIQGGTLFKETENLIQISQTLGHEDNFCLIITVFCKTGDFQSNRSKYLAKFMSD